MRLKNVLFSAICAVGLLILLAGCSSKEQEVVATVGADPITLQDYERLYLRSNNNRDSAAATSMQDRERFLDLMVNYRLKLADAKRMKLDMKPEIETEIQQYKGGLAASFITEREITGPGLRQLYQRRTEEIRASHILIKLAPNASPADSAAAYKKAYEIIQAAKNGGDFRALALENSEDPSVKQNGGDLYYFTGGQMITPFEDAAYAMKVGEISSAPVRTQFGLHIIKILDREPARGEIRASHIMIRFAGPNPSPEDTAAAYAKIKAIQDSVLKGMDFAELAKRNSTDPGSAPKGGDLGWFSRRRWVQPFDEVAFTLKPGQVSGIVRTVYGYHLIKCTDAKQPKTFDDMKAELQQSYQQLRFQDDYNKYLTNLKQKLHVKRDEAVFAQFVAACDSNKTVRDSGATASVSPSLGASVVLTVGPTTLTVDSVIATLKSRPDLAGTPLRAASLATAMDRITEQYVWNVEADSLEQQYPDFAAILKEYKEGVLLYQVEQDNVWNKVLASDSTLRAFFNGHREKFMWPDRVNFTEIRASNPALAGQIAAQLNSGKSMEDVAVADSVRMAQLAHHETAFKRGAAVVTPQMAKSLGAIASDLKQDSTLRVNVIVYPDTNTAKNKALVTRRLDALTAAFTKKFGIAPTRVATVRRVTLPESASKGKAGKNAWFDKVDIEITGRQPLVLGKVEQQLLAPSADERARHADSLAVGAVSAPFPYRGAYSIVRLDKRDPARQKTYEEANGEVSSAFQESESKRLETEWLQSLKQQFPVVQHKDVLKDAFARAQ